MSVLSALVKLSDLNKTTQNRHELGQTVKIWLISARLKFMGFDLPAQTHFCDDDIDVSGVSQRPVQTYLNIFCDAVSFGAPLC